MFLAPTKQELKENLPLSSLPQEATLRQRKQTALAIS
jgi:hypothetical protein